MSVDFFSAIVIHGKCAIQKLTTAMPRSVYSYQSNKNKSIHCVCSEKNTWYLNYIRDMINSTFSEVTNL